LYCHQCIRSYARDARFCSQCGRRLHAITIQAEQGDHGAVGLAEQESAASLEIADGNRIDTKETRLPGEVESIGGTQAVRKRETLWPVFFGLAALALVVASGLFLFYKHELKTNEDVLRLQVEARAAALGGQYDEAIALLEQAIRARPDFRAIIDDNETVHHAAELERLSVEIRQRLDKGDAEVALSELEHLKSELNGHKEPIYDKLKEKADGFSMELTLLELAGDLTTLTTIEEHGEMLNVVNGLIGQEAEELRALILASIRKITIAETEYLLQRKNFSGALSACDKALTWAKEDEELLALKERVKQEKHAYEQAEQLRIQQAMENAAEEDLINQTDAIEVISIDHSLDEFGDLSVVGKLRNKATRPIYGVEITYSVKSSTGEVLGSGTASAAPEYIEPGEEMTFTATVSGIYEGDVVAVIDNKTWYLD
jgi:tetratricopeptide (TPR) repeat protein